MGSRFDDNRPVLVLAPHLVYPLRHGADILIGRRWGMFSAHVPRVDIVGREAVHIFEGGTETRTS